MRGGEYVYSAQLTLGGCLQSFFTKHRAEDCMPVCVHSSTLTHVMAGCAMVRSMSTHRRAARRRRRERRGGMRPRKSRLARPLDGESGPASFRLGNEPTTHATSRQRRDDGPSQPASKRAKRAVESASAPGSAAAASTRSAVESRSVPWRLPWRLAAARRRGTAGQRW